VGENVERILRLAVVVVSYNTRDLLRNCLESVFAAAARTQDRLQVEVIVVDNASSDGSAAMVAAEFPQVRLFAQAENRGFTGGNNLALAALGFPIAVPAGGTTHESRVTSHELRTTHHAPSTPPDFVLLLNPDAAVVEDALWAMAAFLAREPAAGACGARLEYGDGRFQHGAFHFPALSQVMLDLWPPIGLPGAHRLLDSRLNGRYPQALWSGGAPFLVDFVLGAALMVRGDAIRQVGGLDDGYWMYCEEMDWCMRLRAKGWVVYAVPAARVVHHEGQSSRQRKWASFVRLWRSRFRFYARHRSQFSPGQLQGVRALVRLALAQRRRRAVHAFATGECTGVELAAELAAYDEVATQ
jgi:GT2 family glycosyltransferase